MTFRAKVAIAAIVLLVAGMVVVLVYPLEGSSQAWAGGLLRVGLVMAVLWLALPDLSRVPGWLLGAVVVLLVIVARWPRFFFVALAAAAILAFFRPKTGVRPR